MYRIALVLFALLPALLLQPNDASAQLGCDVTLQSGGDVQQAASRARVVCLAPGTYGAFVIDRSSMSGVTVRGLDPATTIVQTSSSQDVIVFGAANVTLSNFTVRGPKGVYVSRSTGVTVDGLRVDGAAIALHVDDNSSANLSNVTLSRSGEVGLLVRNNASVEGSRVQVMDSTLVAVAAAANANSLTLRDSEVARAGKGPGIFAGISGCAELEGGTMDISFCFYSNLGHYLSRTQVMLERVNVHDGPGTGLVFFPGVTAQVRDVQVSRWGLTGLFAWGSDVRISGSTFDRNDENAIEYRSFPDPRTKVMIKAKGTITDTTIRDTQPWQGILGGGVVVQGAELDFLRATITGNTAWGVIFDTGSSGQIVDSRISQNLDTGVCILPGNQVEVRNTEITGNYANDPRACSG